MDKHVNIICTKAARQINVMYGFKGVFDYMSSRGIKIWDSGFVPLNLLKVKTNIFPFPGKK